MKVPLCSFLCGALLVSSCGKRDRTPAIAAEPFAGVEVTNVVAKVNGVPINLQTFHQALTRANARLNKDATLEELIRHETLVAQAKAASYDRDPEMVAAFERMIASRFQEQELAKRTREAIQIAEADIEAAYSRDLDKYTTAASVRAGVIFLAANPRATPEKQGELKQRAEEILARARGIDATGYLQLTQQHSEDQATRYRGGDTGWLKQNDLESRWEPEVLQALFNLNNVGDIAPLISTSRGFYVVRLADTRPATVRALAEVKDGIRYQLTQARQQQQQKDFLGEVRRNSKIEINQALLDSLPEPTNRAARQPPALPGG
jgi:parvulin-like peptidyl-prolyl isomerase